MERLTAEQLEEIRDAMLDQMDASKPIAQYCPKCHDKCLMWYDMFGYHQACGCGNFAEQSALNS